MDRVLVLTFKIQYEGDELPEAEGVHRFTIPDGAREEDALRQVIQRYQLEDSARIALAEAQAIRDGLKPNGTRHI